MPKKAVFPGSFDPVTRGHADIIGRASVLFDEIVIAVGHNTTKSYLFSLEQRTTFLKQAFSNFKNISVMPYSGLTVDFCREVSASHIIRGLRSSADFEFERSIAQMNQYMNPGLDTVFILSSPAFTPLSSTIVREIYRNGGDIREFIPEGIQLP